MYNNSYFEEEIFSYDYDIIAKIIKEKYQPKKIVDFGCGPGHLSKSFAKIGVDVLAIDGFSEPDFSSYKNIRYKKVDFNHLKDFEFDEKFDIAICMEVAEHLKPESSDSLIKTLTSLSDVVIFSAAVPNQGGDGHINCQPRIFWFEKFSQNNFHIVDSIREKIRDKKNVGQWYKFNLIDYKKANSLNITNELFVKLINAESYAASIAWQKQNIIEKQIYKLNLSGVKLFLNLRNFFKKIIGRPPLK